MQAMRPILIASVAWMLSACPKQDNVQCRDTTSCDLAPGGACLVASSGNRWCAYPDSQCPGGFRYSDQGVGEGVGGQCVPVGDVDAGVDAQGDASVLHDAPIGVDGGVDGGVSSGQFADLVIGQNDFTSNIANSGGLSASSLFGVESVASDGTHLWLGDAHNARVLQLNSLPVVNRPLANVVIGEPNATTATAGTTQTTIRIGDVSMFAAGGKLFVVDGTSSRVLLFNPLPAANGAPATIVVGQGDFTTSVGGKSASTLNGPTDVWSDGTRLVVADNANSRVLIWTALPTQNGQAANLVLGRAAFGLGLGDAVANPPTSASMKFPVGVWSNGTRLYVADSGNHRVMVWNTFPTASSTPCDFVLGQATFDANTANAGGATANPIGLQTPYKAIEINGALFISDSMNARVVVHTTIPNTSGAAADAVLGQDNLSTNSIPSTPTGNTMASPRMIAAVGNLLFVPDYTWNRVVRFTIGP